MHPLRVWAQRPPSLFWSDFVQSFSGFYIVRFQQHQGGFNGYQRPAVPQVPVWQDQSRFQAGQNFQQPSSGFQVMPNRGFPVGGHQPFGAEGNNYVSVFKSRFFLVKAGSLIVGSPSIGPNLAR